MVQKHLHDVTIIRLECSRFEEKLVVQMWHFTLKERRVRKQRLFTSSCCS